MFDWIKLAIALLQLVNLIVEKRQRDGLLAEGERQAYAKQLIENAKRAQLIKDVEERLGKASDEEVLKELEKDFRD